MSGTNKSDGPHLFPNMYIFSASSILPCRNEWREVILAHVYYVKGKVAFSEVITMLRMDKKRYVAATAYYVLIFLLVLTIHST